MSWIEQLKGWFQTDEKYEDLTNKQTQAFLDVMTLAMSSDRHITVEERGAITRLLSELPFDTDVSEHAVNQSLRRTWSFRETDEPTIDIYCTTLANALELPWLKRKAYEGAYRIMIADGLVPIELSLLEYLQNALELSDKDVAKIKG